METVRVLLLDIKEIAGRKDVFVRLLSDEDIKRSDRFINDSDKLLSIGSAFLKNKYVDGTISVNSYGKPESNKCCFNISHSHDLVGLAITHNHKVGLDIERRQNLSDDVKAYCLSEHEIKELDKDDALKYFVSKECLVKAEGSGLPDDIKSVPALPLDGEVEYKNKKYYRHTINSNSHYISVALEGADFEIHTEELTGNE